MAQPVGLGSGHRDVSGRGIDVNGPRHSGLEQLVVDGADARADVEQRQIARALTVERTPDRVDEKTRGASWPATTQTAQLAPGLGVIELVLDCVTLAAWHADKSIAFEPVLGAIHLSWCFERRHLEPT